VLADLVEKENRRLGVILIDWQGLREACMGKDALMKKLLNLYLTQLSGWIAEINSAVASGDPDAVRRVCHTVRGATASLHAQACVAALERLNAPARMGETAGLSAMVPDVVQTMEDTAALIRRILAQMG